MIKKIRTSKASKVIACYLALMLLLEMLAPMQAYALTGGPSQPEFNSFTPISTSDMVDLASGDFNYNIPLMDVGGYPINLAYNSGIGMDQEASWVGLGWDLNVGQINRQMRGIPDDFDGDEMIYENNLKENITYGADVGVFIASFGEREIPLRIDKGFGIKLNNYTGFGFSQYSGLTYQIHENLSVGLNMTSSVEDGFTVSPSLSLNSRINEGDKFNTSLTLGVGTSLNSRRGVEAVTISATAGQQFSRLVSNNNNETHGETYGASIGSSGKISFINSTFTPTKRVGMESRNFSFNMNLQGELWGVIEPGAKFTGYKSSQGIKQSEKYKKERAFGYENTYRATDYDILDFNREKDRSVSVVTTTLPVTNYTYDIYSIQGQGIGGMFRPYKGQVGYVFDNHVTDDSSGGSVGGELGLGGGVHVGVQGDITTGISSTKAWRAGNHVISKFEEKNTGNRPDYEKVYFKNVGGFHVDQEYDILTDKLGDHDPIKVGISGPAFGIVTENNYYRKNNTANSSTTAVPITNYIKREKRVRRNQSIQKLTRAEAVKYGFKTQPRQFSPYSKQGVHDHHTSEIRIIKENGERYIYGRAAYNIVKKEVTFDATGLLGNCNDGLVPYFPAQGDNSPSNNRGGDNYFNRITTPAYAHTYLLTAVVSADYSDLTNNGPSDDDLGSYTKFVYNDSKTQDNTYKWRVPYKENHANYDEGLKTPTKDNKGNYIYGEKELLYIDTIVTKTHIAKFYISARKDGYGVKGENGGGSVSESAKMYKLDKIVLYSKPEFMALQENATPIKTVHFEYDYSLCQGVPNNLEGANGQKGKLTLKKVYFTYGKSNMGKYTPYKFSYQNNYNYDMKAYDTWGNYKPSVPGAGCNVDDPLTNAEFPFVDQNNKDAADNYASAWHLKTIDLPSGGRITIDYESDDYKYVQDREVMQMFKVVGCGNDPEPTDNQTLVNNRLYSGSTDAGRLYVELPGETADMPGNIFKEKYIRNLVNEEVYFRFLLNMAKPGSGHDDRYDYVSGYLKLDDSEEFNVFPLNGNWYASIPIKSTNKGDGFNLGDRVNPISKAGWFFGRQYLNRFVYTNPNDEVTDDLEEIVMNIIGSISAVSTIMRSPNGQLLHNYIASNFKQNKSWIRLMHPTQSKIGGGSRVKKIIMHDQWDVMTGHDNDERYKEHYGQEYYYTLKDGSSSGVATYEPLGNKENPFVQPFYDKAQPDQVLTPNEHGYVELPLGESFFPNPKITYSKVTVRNLTREKMDGETMVEVKKHATGKVVTEFFTTKDYPTIASFTDISTIHDKTGAIGSIVKFSDIEHVTVSQGFTIHTNDMDGKMKSQKVYAEDMTEPISGVEYKYSEIENQGAPEFNKNNGKLDNVVITIDSKGKIEEKLIGVDYDVINDFRENRTTSITAGAGVNVATLTTPTVPPIPYVVVTGTPSYAYHESELKTAVTTKVIHTSGILRETIAFDAGSSVSTKNIAWDADTGEVLLTETVNEYNDKYYSFNFPAYWAYDGMKQTATNLGLIWKLKRVANTGNDFKFISPDYVASDFLAEGDEIWVKPDIPENITEDQYYNLDLEEIKAYVVNIQGNKFNLITEQGMYIKPEKLTEGEFKIIRSGFRNMQGASMASVTSMLNPIMSGNTLLSQLPVNLYASTVWDEYRIVNTAAIEYSDTWAAQCECNLPKMQYDIDANDNKTLKFIYDDNDDNARVAYNPYKYNVKGNWRPKVSYAYLTGRNSGSDASPRNSGFYNNFTPFYIYNDAPGVKKWTTNTAENLQKWTYASEVAQYNPYGFEVENKDALNRYSSALYGYNFRFPVAVASNTRYTELAFDGFEDYDFNNCGKTSHFNFNDELKPNKVTVSSSQAHSGRKSLKVAPGNNAIIKKRIVPCTPSNNNN